jgi:hypothetical protein
LASGASSASLLRCRASHLHSEGDDRKALYAAFSAALNPLVVRIDEGAARFIDTPPKLEDGEYKLLYISELPMYPNRNESIQFRICRLHPTFKPTITYIIAGTETSDQAGKKQIIVEIYASVFD